MTEQPSPSVPSLVSLLLCDQIIDDKLSNKKSAIGLFNMIVVPQVPTAIHQLAIMASLTEITGRVELELRLMRDDDNQVLFSSKGHVEAPDPLAVVDLVFAMQGLRIPAAGQYAFEILCRGEILGRRRFRMIVRELPGPPPPGGAGPVPPGNMAN